MGLITYQPFKALYILFVLAFEVVRFPLWVLLYLFPAGRQHNQLTFLQAIGIRVIKTYLTHISAIEMVTPTPLKGGLFQGKRFAIAQPSPPKFYIGELEDKKIVPAAIGGTWYPEPYNAATAKPKVDQVVLHFHGGGFVIGDGRDFDAGYCSNTICKQIGVQRTFAPQYRLSCVPTGRYPAAIQDAVTTYLYLLHELKIPANRIILSGDSAGGNIVFGLLRYIAEHGTQAGIPVPAAGLLWSPWVHLEPAKDKNNILESPQYHTDYIVPGFGEWGSRTYTTGRDATAPYISPMLHPFKLGCPIFIQGGEKEVLFPDILEIYDKYKKVPGNVVGFHAEPYAPHDIALIGDKLGFRAEFDRCCQKAKAFLKENGAL